MSGYEQICFLGIVGVKITHEIICLNFLFIQNLLYIFLIFVKEIIPISVYAPPLQSSASAPHIPQALFSQSRAQEQSQFFLHDQSAAMPSPPVAPQRRTWAQQSQPPPVPDPYHQPELRTWGKPQSAGGGGGGFMLHDTSDR